MSMVAWGLAAVGVILSALWGFQRRLIYLPMGGRVPPAAEALPGGQDVQLRTRDGLALGGWFLASPGGSRGTVIVFNGNAGNRSDRSPLAEALARRGFSVLLFDYRGYGGNPGRPSEEGLAEDARGARSWVDAREPASAGPVVYFGESIGAAVAVALARTDPPDALVLRSPFTSLVDVARIHYPFLPVGWLLKDRYPSLERIREVQCPTLVLFGDADEIVPGEQSRRLYEASGARLRRLVEFRGAHHNDFELLAGARIVGEVAGFVDEVRRRAAGETDPAL